MENKGFFQVLFDFSFTEFITTRLIKVLFALGILGSAVAALSLVITGFRISVGRGLILLLLSPVIFLLYVLLARVWCELVIAVFRIAENTGRLAEKQPPSASAS